MLNGFSHARRGDFVAGVERCLQDVGRCSCRTSDELHAFSWFIVQHIPGADFHLRSGFSDGTRLRHGIELYKQGEDLASMIARGDEEVVGIISEKLCGASLEDRPVAARRDAYHHHFGR